jgi:Uma2 family endonuclease
MASVTPSEIEYPSSDGQPMAETGIHVQAIILLHQALEDFFRDRPDVFIASDMFWYWNPANAKDCTAPDVMVVPGVGCHHRRSFIAKFENSAVPAIVFEMASESTWEEDVGYKYQLYQSLGVHEYVLFDPEDLHLGTQVQVYRLKGGNYHPVRQRNGTYESQLGFLMRAEGTMVRLIDSRTGTPIPTRAEWAADAEAKAADAEAKAADAEAKAADAEAKAADAEAKAADAEAKAEALAAEVERLKALLKNQGSTNGPTP